MQPKEKGKSASKRPPQREGINWFGVFMGVLTALITSGALDYFNIRIEIARLQVKNDLNEKRLDQTITILKEHIVDTPHYNIPCVPNQNHEYN
jgi:hypothetical protein